MLPILWQVGDAHFFTYGSVIVVNSLVVGVWAWRSRPERLFSLEQYLGVVLLTVVGASLGARLAAALQHGVDPLPAMLHFWKPAALASTGVPLIVLPLLGAYCSWQRLPLLRLLDHLLPFAVLGAALQRTFGCFGAGCCAGSVTSVPWAVRFPGSIEAVHPTQLYLGFVLGGVFLLLRRLRTGTPGLLAALGLAAYVAVNLAFSPLRYGYSRLDTLAHAALLLVALTACGVLLKRTTRAQALCASGLLLLLGATATPVLSQTETLLRLDRDDIVWGEVVTLEIAACNPLAVARQGGITVSFSAPVLILETSLETTIYYPGDRLFANGHRRTVPARDVMVEGWYSIWPAGSTRLLRLRFVPLSTGVLRLRARSAILRSLVARQVVNDPASSSCRDQQGYPAICRPIFVQPAPPVLERLRAELALEVSRQPRTLRQLHQLLAETQGSVLRSRLSSQVSSRLGIDLRSSFQGFFDRLSDPDIRDSPQLGEFLRRLLEDPLDREALRFFKMLREAPPEDPAAIAVDRAKAYLAALRGGGNLVSLLAADNSIEFDATSDGNYLVLRYRGERFRFSKGPFVVRDIVEWVVGVQPDSPWIQKRDAVSGTSYDDLLRILPRRN